MARWQPNARERLERVALDLYAERGFDQTTVDDIAQRAGLTERTFFRHFADKREVLFSGQDVLIGVVTDAIASQPSSVGPLDAAAAGLGAAAPVFEANRDLAPMRQKVIAANRSLQERELIKLAALADAVVDALSARGVDAATARVTAEAAVAVLKVAFERWATGPDTVTVAETLDAVFSDLKGIAAQ